MFSIDATYSTRAGLTVRIFKSTPKCKYKYVGYFETRDIRIRIFYNENGDEFFGERGLDLMRRLPLNAGGPLINNKDA